MHLQPPKFRLRYKIPYNSIILPWEKIQVISMEDEKPTQRNMNGAEEESKGREKNAKAKSAYKH
jgi:hypothetical protein